MAAGSLAFALAAAASLVASRRAVTAPERRAWIVLAVVYGVYAAEVWLRIRHAINQVLRGLAQAEHWYGMRYWPQLITTVLAVAIVPVAVAACWRFRRRPSVLVAVVAAAATASTFLAAIISWHEADRFLYTAAGPLYVTGMIWGTCGGSAACAGLVAAKRRPRSA